MSFDQPYSTHRNDGTDRHASVVNLMAAYDSSDASSDDDKDEQKEWWQ